MNPSCGASVRSPYFMGLPPRRQCRRSTLASGAASARRCSYTGGLTPRRSPEGRALAIGRLDVENKGKGRFPSSRRTWLRVGGVIANRDRSACPRASFIPASAVNTEYFDKTKDFI